MVPVSWLLGRSLQQWEHASDVVLEFKLEIYKELKWCALPLTLAYSHISLPLLSHMHTTRWSWCTVPVQAAVRRPVQPACVGGPLACRRWQRCTDPRMQERRTVRVLSSE